MADCDLINGSDDELLQLMAARSADPAAAHAAWKVFYSRYSNPLYGCCFADFGNRVYGQAGLDDVVVETMIRVYEHAKTYRPTGPQLSGQTNPQTMAWLKSIAKNVFHSFDRSVRDANISVGPLNDRLIKRRLANSVVPIKPKLKTRKVLLATKDGLKALRPRDKDILICCSGHYDVVSHEFHVPVDLMQHLCERHAITASNLRQILKRSVDRLRRLLVA